MLCFLSKTFHEFHFLHNISLNAISWNSFPLTQIFPMPLHSPLSLVKVNYIHVLNTSHVHIQCMCVVFFQLTVNMIGYREPIRMGMANVTQPYWKAHRCVAADRMPNPQIGSPTGNQACIISRLL